MDFCFAISDDFPVADEDVAGDVVRLYFYPKEHEAKHHIIGSALSIAQLTHSLGIKSESDTLFLRNYIVAFHHIGRLLLTYITTTDWSESAIHGQLLLAAEGFKFFYGTFDQIERKVNHDREKLRMVFDDIGDHFFVPFLRDTCPRFQFPITKCFFPLPRAHIPPRAMQHYARAAQILSSIQSNNGNIAGCITFNNEVIATTLNFNLTYAILHLLFHHTKALKTDIVVSEEFSVFLSKQTLRELVNIDTQNDTLFKEHVHIVEPLSFAAETNVDPLHKRKLETPTDLLKTRYHLRRVSSNVKKNNPPKLNRCYSTLPTLNQNIENSSNSLLTNESFSSDVPTLTPPQSSPFLNRTSLPTTPSQGITNGDEDGYFIPFTYMSPKENTDDTFSKQNDDSNFVNIQVSPTLDFIRAEPFEIIDKLEIENSQNEEQKIDSNETKLDSVVIEQNQTETKKKEEINNENKVDKENKEQLGVERPEVFSDDVTKTLNKSVEYDNELHSKQTIQSQQKESEQKRSSKAETDLDQYGLLILFLGDITLSVLMQNSHFTSKKHRSTIVKNYYRELNNLNSTLGLFLKEKTPLRSQIIHSYSGDILPSLNRRTERNIPQPSQYVDFDFVTNTETVSQGSLVSKETVSDFSVMVDSAHQLLSEDPTIHQMIMCTKNGYTLSRNYFGKETHFHVPTHSMVSDNKVFSFQKSIRYLELLSIELFRSKDGTQL